VLLAAPPTADSFASHARSAMDGGELCSARCAEQPFDVGFHPNSQIFVAGLITGEVRRSRFHPARSRLIRLGG
jgi:hypothetical protein